MISTMKLLLFLTLSFCFIGGSLSCSCLAPSGISEFKLKYCQADFVIKAKVLSDKITVPSPNPFICEVFYKINQKKHFKNYVTEYGFMIKPKITKVYTASNSAMCGISLQKDETYLLMGRYDGKKFSVHLCSGFKKKFGAVENCDKRWMKWGPSCSWGKCPNFGYPTEPSLPPGPIQLETVQAETGKQDPSEDKPLILAASPTDTVVAG